MKTIHLVIAPASMQLTPEAAALVSRIQNPETLEDALLAVRTEEAILKLARKMQRDREREAKALLFQKPTPH